MRPPHLNGREVEADRDMREVSLDDIRTLLAMDEEEVVRAFERVARAVEEESEWAN